MEENSLNNSLTLRFDNLLLRRDTQNFWEIVEVFKDKVSDTYERIAYWNQEKDLVYCNSRHLDADVIYNFIKLEDLVKNWLLK